MGLPVTSSEQSLTGRSLPVAVLCGYGPARWDGRTEPNTSLDKPRKPVDVGARVMM